MKDHVWENHLMPEDDERMSQEGVEADVALLTGGVRRLALSRDLGAVDWYLLSCIVVFNFFKLNVEHC